ncbi:hypothetical protein QLX08_006689 [Tetragonisca angustula]|uniref:Uncharacterized protein n=1 Tax=Tetragonisca angustula TaxID=166442 RepID=A0AAW0ZSQ2_9HYME
MKPGIGTSARTIVERRQQEGSFEEDVTRDRLLATAHKTARFMLMARVSETLARRKAERKRSERERRSLGEEKRFDVSVDQGVAKQAELAKKKTM